MTNNSKIIKVYLDTCVYNRPFDDQSHPRIYLETTAFVTIMQMVEKGDIELASSSVLEFENSKNPFPLRKLWINDCLHSATQHQKVNESIKSRAKQMEAESIKSADALHVACAEAMGCDYFLTCDDRLIKRYRGNLLVENPVNFILLLTKTSDESENAE